MPSESLNFYSEEILSEGPHRPDCRLTDKEVVFQHDQLVRDAEGTGISSIVLACFCDERNWKDVLKKLIIPSIALKSKRINPSMSPNSY